MYVDYLFFEKIFFFLAKFFNHDTMCEHGS